MPPDSQIIYDAHGRLAGDVYCAYCGYNLRGLRRDGRCGECGAAVDLSLHGGPLTGADPDWLARLRRGYALIACALIWLWLPLGWPFLGWGIWLATSTRPTHKQPDPLFQIARVLVAWLLCPLVTVYMMAVWKIPVWGFKLLAKLPALPTWAVTASVFICIIAVCVASLATLVESRRVRVLCWLLFVTSLMSGVTWLAVAILHELPRGVRPPGILFARLLVPALVGAVGVAVWAWRLADRYEAASRASHAGLRVWNQVPPGESSPSPATPTHNAAPASDATAPAAHDTLPPALPHRSDS